MFTAIAERTPSNGRVGVFFCGPHPMANSVEQAMKAVQAKTILRGVYLGSGADDVIQGELGLAGSGAVDVLRQKGSNIHFVFRKENF